MKEKIHTLTAVILALLALIVAACAPAVATLPAEEPTLQPAATAYPLPPEPTPPAQNSYPLPASPAPQEPAAETAPGKARLALSSQLGIPLEQVNVFSVEEVTWTNGCLDLGGPEEMCTEALVPGYRIRLQAQGVEYVFHSDLSGGMLRQAQGGSLPERPQPGLAFSWRREGGIAGFCDEVSVYLNGEVQVTGCRGSSPTPAPLRTWLDAERRRQLAHWIASLQKFSYETPDKTPADALIETIQFNGVGSTAYNEADIQAISIFASDLVNQAGMPMDVQQVNAARDALLGYFEHLIAADYAGAADLFGGSYEPLIAMNPEADAGGHAALFEHGCAANGYVCTLHITSVIMTYQIDMDAFRFVVELANPDGSPFALGPCCGEDPALTRPLTQFAYEVYSVDGEYKVWDLPVYVP